MDITARLYQLAAEIAQTSPSADSRAATDDVERQQRQQWSQALQQIAAELSLPPAPPSLPLVSRLQTALARGRVSSMTDLARARQAAEAERQHYRDLFDNAPDGYLLTDAEGTISEANRSAATLLGRDRQRLIGSTLSSSIAPDERSDFQQRLQQLRHSRPSDRSWEVTLVSPNHPPLPVAIRVNWLADSKGETVGLRWLLRDISDRQRALDALAASERKFRALFNQSFQLVALLSPAGRPIEVNQTTLDFGGLALAEIAGMPFWRLPIWPLEVRDRIRSAIALAAGGEFVRQELPVRRADGNIIPVDFSLKPVKDERGAVVLTIAEARDVSEWRQSEERFRSIFEQATVGIAQLDTEGQIAQVNQRCAEIFGYRREELAGQRWFDLLEPGTDLDDLSDRWQRLATGRLAALAHEKRYRRQNGAAVWIALSLSAMSAVPDGHRSLLAIVQDISDRKQTEAALQASEEKYRSVVEGIREVIFQTNRANEWTFLNPAWTEITGYGVAESYGRRLVEYLHPEDKEICQERLAALLENRNAFCRQEIRFCTKGGWVRWLEMAVKPLRDRFGRAIGTTGTLNDVTDRKEAEDQLRTVIDTVPGLVAWIGREGRYLGVNRQLAQTFHLQPSDFVGRGVGFLDASPAFTSFMRDFLDGTESSASQVIEANIDGAPHSHLIVAQKYLQGEAAVLVGIDITKRKQAESALRESEEKFRQLAENIDQVFWMLDLPSKRTIYVSPAFPRIWGYSLEFAYSPENSMQAVHPDDYDRVLSAIPLQIRGLYDIEYRIVRPNGETRWIHDRAFPICNEAGKVYRLAGIAADITDRKQAKEALQKRERYLTALVAVQRRLLASNVNYDLYNEVLEILGQSFDASRICVYENYRDEQGRLCAIACAEWQDSALGIDADPPLPESLRYAALSPSWQVKCANGEIVQGSYDDPNLTPVERHFLESLQALSFLIIPLMVGGECFGLMAFVRCDENRSWKALEIGLLSSAAATIALAIDRQLTQGELQQQLTAIEATTDGIFIVTFAGELRYVNPAYRQILGCSEEDVLVGENWRDRYLSAEQARISQEILPQVQAAGGWSGEIRARRQDGTPFVMELSMTLTHKGGEMVCVCRDISDRKQAEEQLKASLEEKELLLKEVHHRVKNNLQVISSIFSLQAQAIEDPQALAVLEESQDRISSMALIHGKLYQSENLSNIDFSEYIRDLVSNLLVSYNANPDRIQTHIRIDDVKLNLDAAIPCGLLLNELVSNSLKHAFRDREEGNVTIAFGYDELGQLHLRVEDDGVGLPEGLDPQKTNSLGISLITSLSQQLQGTLKMYNRVGAVFEVTFPQPIERQRF